jgi:hypothetical protein
MVTDFIDTLNSFEKTILDACASVNEDHAIVRVYTTSNDTGYGDEVKSSEKDEERIEHILGRPDVRNLISTRSRVWTGRTAVSGEYFPQISTLHAGQC